MVVSRYQVVNEMLMPNWMSSKFSFQLSQQDRIYSMVVQAGLYRLTSMYPQHSLILAELAGQPAATSYQVHGKRQRQTSALTAALHGHTIWLFIDRYLNEILYLMKDYKTPKFHKAKRLAKSIAMKNRQRFSDYVDTDDIVEPVMHDTHRGVYLPLTIHFQFAREASYNRAENIMRIFRIPLSISKRRKRKAFDDRVSFTKYV